MDEAGPGARPKQRGGRIVPSRYMQYEKKAAGKAASDASLSFAKGLELTASPKRHPGHFRKYRSTAEMTPGVLQSTMVDSHASIRPDLEFSAINEKLRHRTPISKNSTEGASEKKQPLVSTAPDDLIEMLDSQALLLIYASIKIEKNLSRLEEKAERNLLTLSEEVEKLQKEAHRKKRKLQHQQKQQDLAEALDRQLEALGPLAQQAARFKDQYQHFATALDATRHELPVKDIYLGENKSRYLDDLQERLTWAQKVLAETVQEHTAENGRAVGLAKELEEVSLKVDAELPRAFADVLDLSADVSKEASLHFQKLCEDAQDLETTKRLYFS
ncbi:HAUS augmin-like complex subunit 8 [Pogona vitticeps]